MITGKSPSGDFETLCTGGEWLMATGVAQFVAYALLCNYGLNHAA